MSLSEQIAEARRAKKLTQAELAERIGVSTEAVSKWERGAYEPGSDKLTLLYQVLELNYLDDRDSNLYNEEHMSAFLRGRLNGEHFPETQKALVCAKLLHTGQVLKGPGNTPYINHSLTMTCHALAMGLEEDALLAALLLHDTVENCGVRAEELPVGAEVRHLVQMVTRGSMPEEDYYTRVAEEPRACLIQCIERCNILSTVALGCSAEEIEDCIEETEKYIPPLLTVLKNTPAYNNVSWLLDYQIRGLLRTAKRIGR